ncbi:inversin-like [Phymastichus coffea]|uniref:inversin-like n=1 Tax=Phymastichus coffea TaxID=108790 RepID=UPI00273C57B1|nr:inversin-like [Phymastichus coffea]
MAIFSEELLAQIKNRINDEEVTSIIVRGNLHLAVNNLANTLLHYAAESNNVAITEQLIKLGSDVNAQNLDGMTPLMLSIVDRNCKDTSEMLLRAGANIFLEDIYRINVLQLITSSSCYDCYEMKNVMQILFKNCNLSKKKIADKIIELDWCLPKIILLRNANLTKLLLDRHYLAVIDEEDADFFGCTALHVAAKCVDVENVRMLLKYNANAHVAVGPYSCKALYFVYANHAEDGQGQLEIVKMLLRRYDGLITEDGLLENNVAFMFQRGSKEVVEYLLGTGVDITVVDNAGRNVVQLLAYNEKPGAIELLRGRQLNVNVFDIRGKTPLLCAISHGVRLALEFLLEFGANIELLDYEGKTVLFRVCELHVAHNERQRECIVILLQRGANIQVTAHLHPCDPRKYTILEILCATKQIDFLELFIAHLAFLVKRGPYDMELFHDRIENNLALKAEFEARKQDLTVKVYRSITLLDLLSASERKLERYLLNRECYSVVERFAENCTCYYFKTVLQIRVSTANHMVTSRKEAAQIICKFTNLSYTNFPYIADQIASYFNLRDLEKLFYEMSRD